MSAVVIVGRFAQRRAFANASLLPALVKKHGESSYKKELLSLLRMIFRDALLISAVSQQQEHVLLRVESERLKRVAKRFTPATLLFAQSELSKAELHTFFNATFPQCLELLVAKIFENDAKNRS